MLCVVLAEVVTRLFLPHPQFQEVRDEDLIIENDRRDYAYIPHSSTRWTTNDYQIDIEINGLGLREAPLDPADRSHPTLLAVGDSFTVGFGVQSADAWPEQLENRLRYMGLDIRVINGGVSGYSLRQARLLAEELIPLLEPGLLVAGINPYGAGRIENPFVFFHGHPVRADQVPYLEPTEGGFLYRRSRFEHEGLVLLDGWLNRHFLFGAYLVSVGADRLRRAEGVDDPKPAELARQLRPLLEEIVKIQLLCSSRMIPLVALLVNQQEVDGRFRPIEKRYNQMVARFAAEQGIPLIDPMPAFEKLAGGKPILRFRHDDHWSPIAHREAAQLLAPVVASTLHEELRHSRRKAGATQSDTPSPLR